MVSKRRLNYGFTGYQIPVIPKAPRSARRRHSHKSLDNDQVCAFELLADVAGKLLQESESSASSNAVEGKDEFGDCKAAIKCEQLKEDKAVKSECCDQESCVENTYIPEPATQEKNSNHVENNILSKHISTIMDSEFSKKEPSKTKLDNCEEVNKFGMFLTKVEGGTSNFEGACDRKIETVIKKQVDVNNKQTEEVTVAHTYSMKAPTDKHVNSNAGINSDSSVKLPLYRAIPRRSFGNQRNNVILGIRDDDENSFRSYRLSPKIRAFRQTSRLGYRRIKKMLTSRHWKVAPQLKDYERTCSSGGMKYFYSNRKRICALERHRLETPAKRRKSIHYSSAVAYEHEPSGERTSNPLEKRIKGDIILPRGSGASASVKNHQKKDTNVKFSIKSFKVPELVIEVPETETIGSLKRTVMEAVKTILGSELGLGVVLQGKKVKDDNRTLLQAGISQNGNLDTLGFTLEPSFFPVSQSLIPKDRPFSKAYVADHDLTRGPPSPILDLELPRASSDLSKGMLDKHGDYHDSILSPKNPVDPTSDLAIPLSGALVTSPPLDAEAIVAVPVSPKTSRTELSQRRIRRPFSVAEVEALVEAVEKLGTGRWRDVKMRAFEYADHRTYVDVKDKWKTLVHTASIAPQQRRGEPVPQELLDRVLAAHAYWSQHQAKQHGKQHAETRKMVVDAQVQNVGALEKSVKIV